MRVLLSGPDFHDYNTFISDSFERLGHEVTVSAWPGLWNKFNRRVRLYFARKLLDEYRFQGYVLDVIGDVVEEYNERLLDRIEESQPDVFLVLNGKIILPETIERANNHTTTVMWCYDKATAFPAVVEAGPHYDLFYVFEASDVKDLKPHGIDAEFLPMGYDPGRYQKLEGVKKEIDVSFVGTLDDRRKRLLSKVRRELPDVDLQVWGDNWSWYDPFSQFEYRVHRRKLGEVVHNYNIPAEQVNKVYNRSRICINVHGPHSQETVNPRTFEILGSGSFELTDTNPGVSDLFEIDSEIAVYEDGDALIDRIEYFLDNPRERERIASNGHRQVEENHTYDERIKRILADFYGIE